MAESTQIIYPFQELAALMVKDRGIHEGLWTVVFRFGLKAASIGTTGLNDTDLVPTALVGVLEVGIQRMEKASNLTVDAAVVNPHPSETRKPTKKKSGKRK